MRKDLLLFGLMAAAAAIAVALALHSGSGTVTSTTPSSPDPNPPPTERKPARGVPELVLPKDFPAEARKVLTDAWFQARFGSAEEAAGILERKVTPRTKGGPFDACAPVALEAMAPTYEALIKSDDPRLAATAMRSASALARHGGAEGREALARTGLVEKAFAYQAATGPVPLRLETLRNLGAVGGKAAVEWSVLLLEKAPETEVRVAAAEALGVAANAGRLSPEAVHAVRDRIRDASTPAPLLRACIATVNKAWGSFKGNEIGNDIKVALDSPDDAVLAETLAYFGNHPWPESGEGLLKALLHKDPRIVEAAAFALGELKPPGARKALEGRREGLVDAAALKAVEKALARMPEPPTR